MNGKTTIDAILNPYSAEADKHTWGWKLFNVSFWGKRWVRIGILGVYLDFYKPARRFSFMKRLLYARYGNGAVLFFPYGSLSWPMPERR